MWGGVDKEGSVWVFEDGGVDMGFFLGYDWGTVGGFQ